MFVQQQGYTGNKAGTAIALGYFDGVHLGHQAVIQAAAEYAKQNNLDLAVFTFSLPKKDGIKGKLLYTHTQKEMALANIGVDYCFEPSFESICHMSPQDFFDKLLVEKYQAKALFCGKNFCFGANRAGNVEVLRDFCAKEKMVLGISPTTIFEGEPVSSSRIRKQLREGNIELVNGMLGRPYSVLLPVEHGQGLGHTLGFPTINQIYPDEMQAPREGIYITKTIIGDKAWVSATGYGNRPTIEGVGDTCETFIPNYQGDLYGEKIEVEFYHRICGNIKFENLEELTKAVHEWARQAEEYFE